MYNREIVNSRVKKHLRSLTHFWNCQYLSCRMTKEIEFLALEFLVTDLENRIVEKLGQRRSVSRVQLHVKQLSNVHAEPVRNHSGKCNSEYGFKFAVCTSILISLRALGERVGCAEYSDNQMRLCCFGQQLLPTRNSVNLRYSGLHHSLTDKATVKCLLSTCHDLRERTCRIPIVDPYHPIMDPHRHPSNF